MVAAFGGYVEPVRALLASKADPNAKDNQARTALDGRGHQRRRRGRRGAARRRRRRHAPPMPAAASVMTYAAAAGSAAAIDAAAEARRQSDAARPDAGGHRLLHRRRARAAGVGPEARTRSVDGNAPLLAAAGENCVETVALLLDRGADVNVTNSDGWTPLIKAASANLPDVVRVLLDARRRSGRRRPARSHGLDVRRDERARGDRRAAERARKAKK